MCLCVCCVCVCARVCKITVSKANICTDSLPPPIPLFDEVKNVCFTMVLSGIFAFLKL